MRAMLWTIVIVIAVMVMAFLGFVASRPNVFRLERRANIKAPAERIFPFINDFHQWRAWSPYENIDPTLKRIYGGAESGVGAVYDWSGAGKAGQGRMEIVETAPPNRVTIKLDFFKPFVAHNIAEFTMVPDGDVTIVTWAMSGPNSFMSKLMGMVFNMDKMVGKDFEKGLASLKSATET
jgi:carbon monoxide dehydrogenase subunit G